LWRIKYRSAPFCIRQCTEKTQKPGDVTRTPPGCIGSA
jgi:hypothetical protein